MIGAQAIALWTALGVVVPPIEPEPEPPDHARSTQVAKPIDDSTENTPRPIGPQPVRDLASDRASLEHAHAIEMYSATVSAQFRSFAEVERRRRRLRGALRIGAGALLLGTGVTNFLVKRGTPAEGSGMGILVTGALSLGGGIYSLAVKGPAQSFVESRVFARGERDGWTMEMLEAVQREAQEKAAKSRRLRLAVGSALVAGGAAGAITTSTLLGLELTGPQPDAVRASTYSQGLASSVGLVVAGIVSLAVPTIIEVVAEELRR
ncbi:MAG: hypothetical protein AAF721_03040 [Myxococcota bacterium]